MYIDTHAHLNDKRLYPFLQEINDNMGKDGLESIINVGWDKQSSIEAYDIAKKHQKMYAIIGIHPHDSGKASEQDFEVLQSICFDPKVVAYGEIGLDFFYDRSSREEQERVFKRQIILASSVSLPIVLHVRDAYELTYKILKELESCLNNGVVLHCYSGSAEMVKKFLEFDAYFSLGGAITFKNAKKEEVFHAIPPDRLLLETDCPYMTPEPYRGQINFPKYIKYVANKMEEWTMGVSISELTTKNAKRIFKKIVDNKNA
jgi:TatD DNase family protein